MLKRHDGHNRIVLEHWRRREDLGIYIYFKRKRGHKRLWWDWFGINECFYPVFKREKDCSFDIVCATKRAHKNVPTTIVHSWCLLMARYSALLRTLARNSFHWLRLVQFRYLTLWVSSMYSHARQVSLSKFYVFGFFLLSWPLFCKFNVLNSFPKDCWDLEYFGLRE